MLSRRKFLERTSTSAALGAMTLPLATWMSSEAQANETLGQGGSWNISWPSRLTGKHRALFDVTEVESGYRVWRASAWAGQ